MMSSRIADAHPRPVQRARGPSAVVAGSLFVLFLGTNLPAPLYGIYQERFGFTTSVLTLVFATYTIVLIPSLVVFGQLSDQVGRRPVMIGALTIAALGLLVFAAARGTAWLFVARALQGLAVGGASAGATAALVEVDPEHDKSRAALWSVVGVSGGAATGPLVAGALARWAPWPLMLCYLVGFAATAVVALAVLRLPEPAAPMGRWRLQRPYVPADVRPRFVRASLTGMSVWAVGALFLSVVPSYAGELLESDDAVLRALPTATMLVAASIAHALAVQRRRPSPERLQWAGLALLVVGATSLALAWPLQSLPVLLLAAVVCGACLGLGFGGSQTEINELASDDRRGEVTAAYIMVVYVGITAASLTAGRLADSLGTPRAVVITAGAVGIATAARLGRHGKDLLKRKDEHVFDRQDLVFVPRGAPCQRTST